MNIRVASSTMTDSGAQYLVPTPVVLAAAVGLFGSSWPIVRSVVAGGLASPLWLAASRSVLAAVGAVVLLAALGRLRPPRRQDFPVILAVGLLQLTGFFALSHVALGFVGAGRTALLSNATVVWVAPLSFLLLGERVSPIRWLSVLAGLAGVAVLVLPSALSSRQDLIGYLLLLGAAFGWALAILAARRWPPVSTTLDLLPFAFAVSTPALVGLAVLLEPEGWISAGAWPAAFWNGLVVAPMGTWTLVEISRRLPAIRASVAMLAIPVAGIALSSVWLDEPLGFNLLAGCALIATAVILAAMGDKLWR